MAAPTGRPTRRDSRARTARFFELVAAGKSGRAAAREAGVSLERALDIAAGDEFHQIVAALRTGQIDSPVAAIVDTQAAPSKRAA